MMPWTLESAARPAVAAMVRHGPAAPARSPPRSAPERRCRRAATAGRGAKLREIGEYSHDAGRRTGHPGARRDRVEGLHGSETANDDDLAHDPRRDQRPQGPVLLRSAPGDPEDHLAFARRLGPIDVAAFGPKHADHPEMTVLDQTDAEGPGRRRVAHGQHLCGRCPPSYTVLQSVMLPPLGGDTCFADMYAAWDALSPGNAGVAHCRSPPPTTSPRPSPGPSPTATATPTSARCRRPTRRCTTRSPGCIPETGRIALFVNGNFTTEIDGLEPRRVQTRSSTMLLAHVGSPEWQCRHRWTEGDLTDVGQPGRPALRSARLHLPPDHAPPHHRRRRTEGAHRMSFIPERYADYETTCTIGVVNFASIRGDKPATLAKIEANIREAGAQGIDILVFPEEALVGLGGCRRLPPGAWSTATTTTTMAETVPGPSTERDRQALRRARPVHVAVGLVERDAARSRGALQRGRVHRAGRHPGHLPEGPPRLTAVGDGGGHLHERATALPVFETRFGPGRGADLLRLLVQPRAHEHPVREGRPGDPQLLRHVRRARASSTT